MIRCAIAVPSPTMVASVVANVCTAACNNRCPRSSVCCACELTVCQFDWEAHVMQCKDAVEQVSCYCCWLLCMMMLLPVLVDELVLLLLLFLTVITALTCRTGCGGTGARQAASQGAPAFKCAAVDL